MKTGIIIKTGILILLFLAVFTSSNAQDTSTKDTDTTLLGLPGDNLDLYAVLDLFQKSKTIEDFEKSLNEEKTGINNLDLNLDEKVDFIKVATKKENDDFIFVLQVDVVKGEIQDVAAILVSKDKDKKVTIQIVGDEDLYGKDYVIEPKPSTAAVTPNPAYTGKDTAVASEAAEAIVVESEPIIQYVYSPVYVPYYPPYYYGYYPPYYAPYPVVTFHVYFGRNNYHHHHYHGGHHHHGGNTVVVHNHNSYNNYNRSRHTSNTVNHNKSKGNYKGNKSSNRASTGKQKGVKTNKSPKPSNKKNQTRPSTKPQSKPSQKPSAKPSAKPQQKPQNKPSQKPSAKPQHKPQNKSANKPSQRSQPRGNRGGGGRRR